MAEATKSPARKKRRSSHNVEEEDEGFKFTRQSRRATTYYKGTSKKKRRSSFVHGRKERKSLAPPSSKINLHQNIPVELPPETRLRRLFHASLELAISKITEQQTKHKTDYHDFEDEAKAVIAHHQHVISDTDLIDESWQLSLKSTESVVMLPNPRNQLLEDSAVNCQAVSQRLQVEDRKWDELLQSSQHLQDSANQELQSCSDSSKIKEECPDFLSLAQHKLLSGKPSSKSVLDKLTKVTHHSELQVDLICQTGSILKQYADTADIYLQKQMESFGSKSVQIINDMGTPRTLIRGQLKHH